MKSIPNKNINGISAFPKASKIQRWVQLILIVFCSNNVLAQDYFNKVIPFEFGAITASSIYQFEEQFYITGIYTGNKSTIISINDNFDVSEYHLFDDFSFSRRPLSYVNNKIFFFSKDRSLAKALSIGRLNEQFKFDFNKSIETVGEYNFATNSKSINENIYSSYFLEIDGGDIRQIGIAKHDTSGVEIWNKVYNQDIELSYPWMISPTLDNNLLLSAGVHYYYQLGRYSQITKLDQDGNEIWKYSGEEAFSSGAVPNWTTELSDSSIVQTYEVYRWNDPEFLLNDWTIYVPRMIWLDKLGNKIKEIYLNTPNPSRIYMGGLKRGKGDYFYAYGSYSNQEEYGLITKYSNEGDTLWTHQYQHPNFSSGINVVKDIIELDNGDILALGRVSNPGENSEIWLFKVNAEGCFSAAPCADIVSATSPLPAMQDAGLSIYPNPTASDLHIELAQSTIDQLKIFDVRGRLLQQVEVDQQQMSLNIGDWADGLYILQVIDVEGKVYVDKFVKE